MVPDEWVSLGESNADTPREAAAAAASAAAEPPEMVARLGAALVTFPPVLLIAVAVSAWPSEFLTAVTVPTRSMGWRVVPTLLCWLRRSVWVRSATVAGGEEAFNVLPVLPVLPPLLRPPPPPPPPVTPPTAAPAPAPTPTAPPPPAAAAAAALAALAAAALLAVQLLLLPPPACPPPRVLLLLLLRRRRLSLSPLLLPRPSRSPDLLPVIRRDEMGLSPPIEDSDLPNPPEREWDTSGCCPFATLRSSSSIEETRDRAGALTR